MRNSYLCKSPIEKSIGQQCNLSHIAKGVCIRQCNLSHIAKGICLRQCNLPHIAKGRRNISLSILYTKGGENLLVKVDKIVVFFTKQGKGQNDENKKAPRGAQIF